MKNIATFIFTGFLLLSSISATKADPIRRANGSRFESDRVTKTITLDGIENLSITTSSYLSGKLTVRAVNDATAKISYVKHFKADSEATAEEYSEYVTLSFEDLENEFSISAETRSSPPWRGTDYSAGVDIEILVPRKTNVKVFARTSQYEIEVIGPFVSADIVSNFGDTYLEKIVSKVSVSSDNGAVTVADCTGPIKVTTSNRPIALRNIDGQLGSIRLRNQNGKISLDSVRGEIDARTEFAQITASNVRFESGRSTLATESSNIKVDAAAVSGDLSVRSENGKIEMGIPSDVSASILLQVEQGGRIYTKQIPIEVDRVSRTVVQGRIGNAQNKIEVDMAGVGTINLEGIPASSISRR